MEKIARDFEHYWQFPHCIGIVLSRVTSMLNILFAVARLGIGAHGARLAPDDVGAPNV